MNAFAGRPMPAREIAPPPANIEIEQALLGAIMVNNDTLQIVGNLAPEHFFDPLHAQIYDSLRRLVAAGKRASASILASDFRQVKVGEELNGSQYVARLMAEATTIVDAQHYAATIIDLATKRNMIALAQKMDEAARGSTVDISAAQLLDEVEANITAMRSGQSQAEATSFSLRDVAARLIARAEDSARRSDALVPTTGLRDIDEALGGGYPPKTMIVFAGATGSGKTQFMASSARKTARSGWGVLIFSLELDKDQVGARLMAAEMAHAAMRGQHTMSYSDAIKPKVDPQTLEQMRRAAERVDALPVEIVDTPGLTTAQIAARVKLVKAQMAARGIRLGVVFVDYLGLIRPPNMRDRQKKVNELGDIALDLREMAKREELCVVALAQVNRSVHGRDDKRPVKSDLRESGEVEEHADAIGMIYRPAYYDRTDPKRDDPERAALIDARKHDLEINFDKNRLGAPTTITVYCDVGTGLIDMKRGF